jgi:hypothetical protein
LKRRLWRPRPGRADEIAEVGTWSDKISDAVVTDLVAAVLARPQHISREYDIPYIAGYSRDGRTVFIDRHMPKSFRYRGRDVETDRFLVVHEVVEKALLDTLSLHYLHAHQIALRTEQAAVRAAGVGWHDYNAFTEANEKSIVAEQLKRVPADLDLTPYGDEEELALLQQLVAAERKRGRDA